jgi:hypothetical protein
VWKRFSQYRFEVIVGFSGVTFAAAMALIKYFSASKEKNWDVELAVGFFSMLVPVAIARMESLLQESREQIFQHFTEGGNKMLIATQKEFGNVSEIIRKTREAHEALVTPVLAHLQESLDNDQFSRQRAIALTSGFLSLLENLSSYVPECPDILGPLSEITSRMKDLSEGKYPIENPNEIYRHDARKIASLKPGESYRATWSHQSNPQSMMPSNVDYEDYINEQIKAVQRGVLVERIYIVPNPQNPHLRLLSHLKRLKENGISVRLIDAAHLVDDELSEDFVIIGKRVLGIAVPKRGPMVRSIYYFNPARNVRPEYVDYQEFFRKLKASSIEFGS